MNRKNTITNTEELLTRKEAAKFLTISPSALEALKRKRHIPYMKISTRCIRFRKSDCQKFLEE